METEKLTLRDHFAIAALPALINGYGKSPITMRMAYEVADEMILARAPKVEPTDFKCRITGTTKCGDPKIGDCDCMKKGGEHEG